MLTFILFIGQIREDKQFTTYLIQMKISIQSEKVALILHCCRPYNLDCVG
jgi:hypothetical protein